MYTIKSLEWSKFDHRRGPVWAAIGTELKEYSIEKHPDEYRLFYGHREIMPRRKTIEEAQGAAQYHFESEVMKFLDVSGDKNAVRD